MKRPRTIQIMPMLNGYVVAVGCQSVVFESREKLLSELALYLSGPDEMEKLYIRDAINPMESDGGERPVNPAPTPRLLDEDIRRARAVLQEGQQVVTTEGIGCGLRT